MTEDEKLRNAFERLQDGARQAQLRWVTVTGVDKENLMMDAVGVSDNLEYYGIQLGMGAFNIYPEVGTGCLVGIVEGQETDAFLISAEEIEEVQIKAATAITFNDGKLGGLVKVSNLTDKVNELIEAFNTHTHTLPESAVKVQGSATSQANVAPITVPAIDDKHASLKREEIENERVKQ